METTKVRRCSWCKGKKGIYLKGKGYRKCFNCHGTGSADGDGGRLGSGLGRNKHMIGNQYTRKDKVKIYD